MEAPFLGMPDVSVWLFAGLVLTAFLSSFLGMVTGAAGGLLMLAVMAMFFPPAILIPLHTVHQLGVGVGRMFLLWKYILRPALIPFLIGTVIGAATGAQVFVALPSGVLQGFLAVFVLSVTWTPNLMRIKGENSRGYALLGFAATFLGIFVSATGTLLSSVLAKSTDDRRYFSATFSAMMSMVHIAKLVAFGFVGLTISAYVPLVAAMIAAAFVANWAGKFILLRMKEERFRYIFKILLTLLALRLLWAAAQEFGWL
jgi:uncharacterized membrane protein YfcA